MSKALLLVTDSNWQTAPAISYVPYIKYLDRRLFNKVAKLFDEGLLERQPLSIIKQEEKVDGKNYDIYKVIAELAGQVSPKLEPLATAIVNLHNVSVQWRFHPTDNSNEVWQNAIMDFSSGRTNTNLDYSILHDIENEKPFLVGASHQTVMNGMRLKTSLFFLYKALIDLILKEHGNKTSQVHQGKESRTGETPEVSAISEAEAK